MYLINSMGSIISFNSFFNFMIDLANCVKQSPLSLTILLSRFFLLFDDGVFGPYFRVSFLCDRCVWFEAPEVVFLCPYNNDNTNYDSDDDENDGSNSPSTNTLRLKIKKILTRADVLKMLHIGNKSDRITITSF